MTTQSVYSLFQKKRTFNFDFFRGPPGGRGPKIHMVDYVTAIFVLRHATRLFKIYSKRLQIF